VVASSLAVGGRQLIADPAIGGAIRSREENSYS
jgi:hypothetical protein